MNNDIVNEKKHFPGIRCTLKGNIKIIETNEEKNVIKKKINSQQKELYNYLHNRNFNYYLPVEKEEDDFEIYRYIEESKISNEDKAIDLMYILSMLHNKTTTYREIILDDVKKNYEETKEKINKLREFYYGRQDYIESKRYYSPEEYLLIKHASDIYASLNYAENTIEEWYKLKVTEKQERIVLNHNNLKVNHLIESENKYLISWNQAKKDIVIYDFLKFYKNEYLNLEMNSLFEIYQSKYKYTKSENLLFQALIAIPEKLSLKDNHYENTQITSKLVKYVIKTRNFILKENEKYQEVNQHEQEEQNNSV